MTHPKTPVTSGDTNQEMKIFLVSFQLIELMPLAATENPMMEPTILRQKCKVVIGSVRIDRCTSTAHMILTHCVGT